MTLMKNVNGVDVQCTPEEEKAFYAEWAANDAAKAAAAKLPKPMSLDDRVAQLEAAAKAAGLLK